MSCSYIRTLTEDTVTSRAMHLLWLVNLASLVYDVDQQPSGRVFVMHSVVTGLIFNVGDHGILWWWDLISSKHRSTASVCHMQCLPDFLVMVIQFIEYKEVTRVSAEKVHCCLILVILREPLYSVWFGSQLNVYFRLNNIYTHLNQKKILMFKSIIKGKRGI